MCLLILGLLRCSITAGALQVGQAQPAPGDYKKDCASSGCHDEYGKRAVVHKPVASKTCDSCHITDDIKTHRFRLVAQGPDLCAVCHQDFSKDLKFMHGPVAVGACTVCHDVHASDHAGMTVDETTELCLNCHTALKGRLTGGTFKHDPVTEDCSICHLPHGGNNRFNLKLLPPDLCLNCHDVVLDIMNEATVKHDALTTDKSCVNCHEPHVSAIEHILLLEPMDLCLSCHDRELKSGEEKIGNIDQLLSENPNHHGPILQKNCTSCHSDVHGGAKFRLLIEAYPPEFYAPFEEERYAICFRCHESDVVQDERTDDLTNFRNGDVNLHYLHVNRKVKGRTCRACHDIHASNKPRHITESVPFGSMGWKIPINFEKTQSGGSCLPGCHKKYRYDRTSPVAQMQP